MPRKWVRFVETARRHLILAELAVAFLLWPLVLDARRDFESDKDMDAVQANNRFPVAAEPQARRTGCPAGEASRKAGSERPSRCPIRRCSPQ
jgi:hypothetical protein